MSPDAGLEAALDQRRRKLDLERQVLAEREIAVQQQAAVLAAAGSRVRMVLSQIEFAQQPAPGIALPVALLGELEQLLRWCEAQVVAQRAHLEALRSEADEARAAERAEKQRRIEIREADETAARVHAQKVGTR